MTFILKKALHTRSDLELYESLFNFTEKECCDIDLGAVATDEDVFVILDLLKQNHTPDIYYLVVNILCLICVCRNRRALVLKTNVAEILLDVVRKVMASKLVHNDYVFQINMMLIDLIAKFILFLSSDESLARVVQLPSFIIETICQFLSPTSLLFAGTKGLKFLETSILKKQLIGFVTNYTSAKKVIAADEILCQTRLTECNVCFVELYDTSSENDQNIIDDILREGVAASSVLKPKEKDLSDIDSWKDVYPTCIVNSYMFWAVIGSSEIRFWQCLQTELSKICLAVNKVADKVKCGDICLVNNHGENSSCFRCCILSCDECFAKVFAVDHGFVAHVLRQNLYLLPQSSKLADVQATVKLCILPGEKFILNL